MNPSGRRYLGSDMHQVLNDDEDSLSFAELLRRDERQAIFFMSHIEKSLDLHPPSPSTPISIDHNVRRLKNNDQSRLKDEYPRLQDWWLYDGKTRCAAGICKITSMPCLQLKS